MLVYEFVAVAELRGAEVAVVVGKNGLDGLHLAVGYCLYEWACLVDFLLVGVNTLSLVYACISVGDVALCKLHDVGLGYLAQAVDTPHFVLPFGAVYERLDKHVGARFVVLKLIHE